MPRDFYLNSYLFLALASERAEAIARAFETPPSIPDGGQWINRVRNDDELGLERQHPDPDAVVGRADTEQFVRPVISGGRFGYKKGNVAEQRAAPDWPDHAARFHAVVGFANRTTVIDASCRAQDG